MILDAQHAQIIHISTLVTYGKKSEFVPCSGASVGGADRSKLDELVKTDDVGGPRVNVKPKAWEAVRKERTVNKFIVAIQEQNILCKAVS